MTDLNIATFGDSLTLGHEDEAVEYTRDFYGYGTQPGDSSDPGDAAYDGPKTFSSWRASLQLGLHNAGFEVDMVGTLGMSADLPDTVVDSSGNPVSFIADGRTFTYDGDHNGHPGWHSGGLYDLSNINAASGSPSSGLTNANGGATTGFGTFTYTPGQVPNSTYNNNDVTAGDLIDTGSNGKVLDGFNTFNRGLKDHMPEFDPVLASANVVFLQVGINDIKDREDVEGSGSTVTERVSNGNLQQRIYDLILDMRSRTDPTTAIYVSNLAINNDDDKWASVAEMEEAIDAFNDSFLAEYFSGGFIDAAGYDDAYAVGDIEDGLANVYLLNTHERIDEVIGLSGNLYGSVDYLRALDSDGLHWTQTSNDYVGNYFADIASLTVPSPASAPLLLAGLGLIASRRRRR
ncbi:MAG: hypothetical protein ACPGYV_08280 [Phycisphaeraceae bacterium]